MHTRAEFDAKAWDPDAIFVNYNNIERFNKNKNY
jgi:hypothetical protein